jgi:hypothetical protein
MPNDEMYVGLLKQAIHTILDLQIRVSALTVAVKGRTEVTEQDISGAEKALEAQAPGLPLFLAQLDVLPDQEALAALQALLTKLKL